MRLSLTLAALLLCTPAHAQTSPCEALQEMSGLWHEWSVLTIGDFALLTSSHFIMSLNPDTAEEATSAIEVTGRMMDRMSEVMEEALEILNNTDGCDQ
jgi:hypothetical protein